VVSFLPQYEARWLARAGKRLYTFAAVSGTRCFAAIRRQIDVYSSD